MPLSFFYYHCSSFFLSATICTIHNFCINLHSLLSAFIFSMISITFSHRRQSEILFPPACPTLICPFYHLLHFVSKKFGKHLEGLWAISLSKCNPYHKLQKFKVQLFVTLFSDSKKESCDCYVANCNLNII